MAAAIASILEMDLKDIPEFENMGKNKWWPALRRWVKKQGYHLLSWEGEFYLPGYFIASGMSPRGFMHCVIYKGTKMVHDPHPSRDGIEKMIDLWAFLPLDPARFNVNQLATK